MSNMPKTSISKYCKTFEIVLKLLTQVKKLGLRQLKGKLKGNILKHTHFMNVP